MKKFRMISEPEKPVRLAIEQELRLEKGWTLEFFFEKVEK